MPGSGRQPLAHWQYSPAEWRRFGEYEGRHYVKMIRQTKTALTVLLILTVLALAAVPVFGLLKLAPWDRGMVAAVFLISLFGGGLLAVGLLVWMIQRSKLATLTASTGDVLVTDEGISTSGIWHAWNYGELGSRFYDARIMTLKAGTPDEMKLLEVRTVANTVSGSAGPGLGTRYAISSCRVPIPEGRMAEAESALAAILERASLREPY